MGHDEQVHIHLHFDSPININIVSKQDPAILTLLSTIQQGIEEIKIKMSVLDDKIATLTQDVTDENTIIDSAITLISGIPKLISDAVAVAIAAGATPAQLQGLTDLATSIEAKKTSLAAAISANVPPNPPPVATP
jgi:hypothetical protein